MRLQIERLEDRTVFSAYTVQVLDTKNLIPATVEDQMRAAGDYVMKTLANHISWKGTVDLQVNVQPPRPDQDGITPAIMQVTPDRRNATIYEMQTGVDLYPTRPDCGMTVFLGTDGTVKLYGMKAYFDPDPVEFVPANVPNGYFDFIGVLNHEVAHALAFQGTTEFTRYLTTVNGYNYFNGPETVKTLGRPLPMSTFGGTHYGNGLLPDNPITTGLMYQWGNYAGNRLDWGTLDYAVLRDVGLTTKNLAGIPLVDRIDTTMPRLVTSQSNVDENLPVGTVVTTLSTNLGSNYTFEIVAGLDASSFWISGRTLLTGRVFDYEDRTSFKIIVRSIDTSGVWTDTRLTIRVNDVVERPTLLAPSAAIVRVDQLIHLGLMQVRGDNKIITVSIESKFAPLISNIKDPSVRVSISNRGSGTTLTLVGLTNDISRNFRLITYKGADPSLTVSLNFAGVVTTRQITFLRPRPAA